MTLGEQIKQARDTKNLSQEDLAGKLGVSRQAVSKWENDSAIPQGLNREMLSQVLELDILKNEIELTTKRRITWVGWMGWIVAFALAVVLGIISYTYTKQETDLLANNPQEGQQNATMPLDYEQQPQITQITFYDEDQNKVEPEALWYNAAHIESIMIQWEGGPLDHIKMFGTPSGTETMEMTELLLTKSVLDGDGVALLNADVLKGIFQTHLYFELYFGENLIVASDLYNVFYDENF